MNLTLMNPWLAAAGLAAVGLAVWMHLYRRQAGRRVEISSLRLAPETPRIARSRQRIQFWPLLLLRALGVILLGLAFARPGPIDGAEQAETGREALALVLDRSGSMRHSTAWNEALATADRRLSELHPESRVRLFCYPHIDTGEEWIRPAAMRGTIAALAPTFAQGRPLAAIRAATEALARFQSDMPESLEIVSDLQDLGWDELATLTLPEELQLGIHQVGDPEAPNRGLSLQVRGRDQLRRGAVITEGATSAITITDAIAGEDPVSKELPFPSTVEELPYRATSTGWARREVRITEPDDGLPIDDTLYDAFYVTPEIPVYLIEPQPDREAFLQATFFLFQALRPKAGEGAQDSRFRPVVVPLESAVETLGGVSGAEAALVIPALGAVPEGLPAAVRVFAEQGGGVLFFAGPDLQPAHWQELLPAMLGEPSDLDRSFSLPPIGEDHPLWGGLSEGARRQLRRAPLRTRLALEPSAEAQVLARYADDIPLAVIRPFAAGQAMFVNTSPDRKWSDWPVEGALFVPTVHMLVSAAVTSSAQLLRNSPGAGTVAESFDLRVEPDLANSTVQVNEQSFSVEADGWVRGLRFDRPGLFDLTRADGSAVRPLAVNLSPHESRRDFVHPVVLQRQLESRRRVAGTDTDSAHISMATESDCWRWILAIVIVLWLVEPVLALRPAEAGADA